MNDTDTLIARLRGGYAGNGRISSTVMREAADRIEALEADNAALREDLEDALHSRHSWINRHDAALAAIAQARRALDDPPTCRQYGAFEARRILASVDFDAIRAQIGDAHD